jgi:diadenosine tetraphosphate (Ap4A) HIT family hydrolase
MTDFAIHERLLTDCHRLGRLPATHLLLHRNAALPWLILVPETGLDNLLDLPPGEREAVLADCARVCDYLRGPLGCPKVNVAWIGNLVPQLHIHLIGRRPGDACWPLPVWGHLARSLDYPPQRVAGIARDLIDGVAGAVAETRPSATLEQTAESQRPSGEHP